MLYAPFDGTVRMLFPTKHAIGLSVSGVKPLIHIGIQYSESGWKIFEAHTAGRLREKGQLLVSFEKEKTEQEGYSCEIPVICKTQMSIWILEKDHDRHVHGEDILHVIR